MNVATASGGTGRERFGECERRTRKRSTASSPNQSPAMSEVIVPKRRGVSQQSFDLPAKNGSQNAILENCAECHSNANSEYPLLENVAGGNEYPHRRPVGTM